MSNLARRLYKAEQHRARQRAADPRLRTPEAWTRRFLDADPAHAALLARIAARPTSRHMSRMLDPHDHLGHVMIGLIHEATYEVDDDGKVTAMALDNLPHQHEAVEFLNELCRLSKAYQQATGDRFPIPAWGV